MQIDDDFLILLFSDTQPRRPKLIENLLAGKKTVSTLFWGMRYELINYCELFSNYKNFNIINNLKLLIDKKYLKKTIDGEHLLLTSAGKEQQNDILNNYYLPRHSEIYHKYNILRFKKRFLLALQVSSEYSFSNKKYYPLKMNILEYNLIKKWFKLNKDSQLSTKMYRLLYTFAESMNDDMAWQLMTTLTGHAKVALTADQQSKYLNTTILQLYFRQIDMFCVLLKFIKSSNEYNFLEPLTVGIRVNLMSNASLKTFELFLDGYSLNETAYYRHIKVNTVKEHLLNAAITLPKKQFPYNRLLSLKSLKIFQQRFTGNIDDWQFTAVKNDNLSFFDFRLYQIFRSKVDE